jgi:hypothetical protein
MVGWRAKRGLHTPTSENHSLVYAGHALVRECPERTWLVSVEPKDDGGHGLMVDHSLVRASHAPARGCPERTRLVSVESEDDDGHGREERVVLKLEEERRSKFENFNL